MKAPNRVPGAVKAFYAARRASAWKPIEDQLFERKRAWCKALGLPEPKKL